MGRDRAAAVSNFSKHYHEPLVVFSTNQYVVPYMARNPTYHRAIRRLFPGEGGLFHPLAKFLFRPLPSLVKERDAFIEQQFRNRFVVGLQVRSGADFTDHFMSKNDWSLYGRCAQAAAPLINRSQLLLFVATDTQRGRMAAVEHLGPLVGRENVIFGPGPFLLSNDARGVQMALLDLLLLAASHDRVTTAWSTFGYFAGGYSGRRAAMVVDRVAKLVAAPGEEQRYMGVPHKSDRRRQCVRLPTSQPCFHKFESWGASRATCFEQPWMEEEMLHGRYC